MSWENLRKSGNKNWGDRTHNLRDFSDYFQIREVFQELIRLPENGICRIILLRRVFFLEGVNTIISSAIEGDNTLLLLTIDPPLNRGESRYKQIYPGGLQTRCFHGYFLDPPLNRGESRYKQINPAGLQTLGFHGYCLDPPLNREESRYNK